MMGSGENGRSNLDKTQGVCPLNSGLMTVSRTLAHLTIIYKTRLVVPELFHQMSHHGLLGLPSPISEDISWVSVNYEEGEFPLMLHVW